MQRKIISRDQALNDSLQLKTEYLKNNENNKGVVFLMCGIAGAGKTTFAKDLEMKGKCIRFSIDEVIWEKYGQFDENFDYYSQHYLDLLVQVKEELRKQFIVLLRDGEKKSVVLDYSFWSAEHRREYKKLIEENEGYKTQVIYFDVPKEELKRRLVERSKRRDANAAYTITDEILERYYSGFQSPESEPDTWIVRYE